jgi:hypothetical protein
LGNSRRFVCHAFCPLIFSILFIRFWHPPKSKRRVRLPLYAIGMPVRTPDTLVAAKRPQRIEPAVDFDFPLDSSPVGCFVPALRAALPQQGHDADV